MTSWLESGWGSDLFAPIPAAASSSQRFEGMRQCQRWSPCLGTRSCTSSVMRHTTSQVSTSSTREYLTPRSAPRIRDAAVLNAGEGGTGWCPPAGDAGIVLPQHVLVSFCLRTGALVWCLFINDRGKPMFVRWRVACHCAKYQWGFSSWETVLFISVCYVWPCCHLRMKDRGQKKVR